MALRITTWWKRSFEGLRGARLFHLVSLSFAKFPGRGVAFVVVLFVCCVVVFFGGCLLCCVGFVFPGEFCSQLGFHLYSDFQ